MIQKKIKEKKYYSGGFNMPILLGLFFLFLFACFPVPMFLLLIIIFILAFCAGGIQWGIDEYKKN